MEERSPERFEPRSFGKYVLLERIGRGGMAEVYRAKMFGEAGFEKDVAIKKILPGLMQDDEFVAMFIDEAKLTVSLSHANIVQVLDLGRIEDTYYIAMEYVPGKDLLDLLATCARRRIRLPHDLAIYICLEMLSGLSSAHRAAGPGGVPLNIVHRDVSPSNILLSYDGSVKVGDFGIAKSRLQSKLTEIGTQKGKIGYMSPEQVTGSPVDFRSDVFSSGVILYEMLTMTRLFKGPNERDVMLKIRDAAIEEDLGRARGLNDEMKGIIRTALQRDPGARYPSAEAFHDVLQDFAYRHGLRTGRSRLSPFLHTIFAERIEQEHARRQSDPHGPLPPESPEPGEGSDAGVEESGFESPGGRFGVPQPGVGEAPPWRPESTSPRQPEGVADLLSSLESMVLSDLHPVMPQDTETPRPEPIESLLEGPYPVEGSPVGPVGPAASMSSDATPAPPSVEAARSPLAGTSTPSAESTSLRESLDSLRQASEELLGLLSEPAPPPSGRPGIATPSPSDASPPPAASMRRPAGTPTAAVVAVGSTGPARITGGMPALTPTLGGRLGALNVLRLLVRLTSGRSTGQLRLATADHVKSVFLRDGAIILVDSSRPEDLLGNFLVSRGVLTPTELALALDESRRAGRMLGDTLVATGRVALHALVEHLSAQMAQKLVDVLLWREGTWEWYAGAAPTRASLEMPVDFKQIVASGVATRCDLAFLRSYIAGRERVPLRRNPALQAGSSGRLAPRDLRIANQVEAGESIESFLRRTMRPDRSNEADLLRALFMIIETEFLRFDGEDVGTLPGADPT